MKFNRLTRLVISLWLALSIIISPLAVYAEGESTHSGSLALNTESAPIPESTQATTVSNDITSSSESGSSSANNNTDVGTLSTGDSSSISTVITTDNATTMPSTDSFSLSPTPNSIGDITLNLAPQNQIALSPTIIPLTEDTENVTNTITITSLSGSSTASDNTRVEQINTGDAYSNANVINILGSNVSAPEIFLGYITIDGSLTGDILLPASFLQSLNAPAPGIASPVYLGSSSDNTYGVDNAVDATANSGSLSATSNSTVGSVKSGSATNMLNSLDLVGLNIFGQSGLLVFVNVNGTWDGSILSQAPGVRAALIGSDSTGSTPYLIPLDASKSITLANNINVSATSGDITAKGNTTIGEMNTGSATTVVNLANILGSNLIFTKQFGILFITVLGNWYGSFGFDTPYGNPTPIAAPAESPTATSQQISRVNSSYVSIKHIASDDLDDISTEIHSSSYSEPLDDYFSPRVPNKNKSLLDLMIWGIPLVGGSIALGLVRTDKKTTRPIKK